MEYYLSCCDHGLHTEQEVRYRRQLQALQEVYAENPTAAADMPGESFGYYHSREIYLIEEVIRCSRLANAYSQWELGENICAQETLPRFENGHRTPNRNTFQALMEKLKTGVWYYNTGLDTTNFRVLEMYRGMEWAISLDNMDEAKRLLDKIREELKREGRAASQNSR